MRRHMTALCLAFLLAVNGLQAGGPDAALADAAEHLDRSKVRALLKERVAVDAPQPDGMTALHWAIYHNDPEMAEQLLAAGASVKAANRYGVTPLSLACTNGSGRMVELLLTSGADPSVALPGGETPLMTAARTGSLASVKALLSRGAAVDGKDEARGQTALMWAAAEGHADVVAGARRRGRGCSRAGPLRLHAASLCRQRRTARRGSRAAESGRRRQRDRRRWRPEAVWRTAAAGRREPSAAGGDERAFRVSGGITRRRRESERRFDRLLPASRDYRGAQPRRRRQRSGSTGIWNDEQYRAGEETRRAWRRRQRQDDETRELEQHPDERDRRDPVSSRRADRRRGADDDAGRTGRRTRR